MKILITAGPTREPIDPVRYLSNRSSGKMGYALAEAALAQGHEVVLISGPVSITPPATAQLVQVETAAEMYDAVAREIDSCQCALFCAAVADYRVKEIAESKIKKSGDSLTLTLIQNPDILGSVRSQFEFSGILVGFAAETDQLESHARAKLERKGCDLLVANDVSRSDIGFDHDENEVVLFYRNRDKESLPRDSKRRIAHRILEVIEKLSSEKGA
jgi:phosphopantothenoylcysteine decarboxylase/phosphopantothenate--cysteine ligase